MRIAELEHLLRDHPLAVTASKHGLCPDHEALGQHYGIPTDLLDLSSSVEIAAFFAVTKWNGDACIPATSGSGVMYRVHWQRVPDAFNFFDCIGHGPGTRPAFQHAWSFRLRRGVDFETCPDVEVIEFEHDEECSRGIMALFAGGARVYPQESLVSVTRKLMALPFVTMHGIRRAIAKDIDDPARVNELADLTARGLNEELGIEIVEGYQLALESEDVQKGRAEAERLDRTLLEGVGFHLVRTLKSPSDPESVEDCGGDDTR